MDKYYMQRALDLAQKGKGKVNPNPLVGAIIVKNGEIIGEGYHEAYGRVHAEINAFNNSIKDVKGATIYVTLEPCSHYGKTPPCVDKIIDKKISKVVIGMVDPNPLVAGKGVTKLQEAGIEVIIGVLEKECKKINEVFIKYITKKQPFVVLKTAMSLDGKIATKTGESKWITGEKARYEVQQLRNQYSAIMVGVDTVIMDNPQLTCRIPNGRNPIRIVVDSKLRTPLESNIVKSAKDIRTILVTTKIASEEKVRLIEELGVVVIKTNCKNGKVDLIESLAKLGEQNIDSILLEGGGTLNYSALKSGIVDKIIAYISPKIIGGISAKTSIEGEGIEKLEEAFKLEQLTTRLIDKDIFIEGYVKGCDK